jgi:hypothetical protein
MKARQRVMVLLLLVLMLALLVPVALVIGIDPFQIYHRPWTRAQGFLANQRYQNAGLINSYLANPAENYDSVIIGTSMSENFTGEDVSRILGWKKALRLPMAGAVAGEQLAVLSHALATGRVRHVLLEIHPFLYQDPYHQTERQSEDKALYFPAYLYNETWFDDAPYVLNIDVLRLSWKVVTGRMERNTLTPENIGHWGDKTRVDNERREFNAPKNLEQLRAQTAGFHIDPLAEDDIGKLGYPALDELLVPLLQRYCNQDTDFELFVPPWPRFRYQKSTKMAVRSIYLLRHILKPISACANMHLYDFDNEAWTGDLNYYKDEQHYLPSVNRELLIRMARHENEMNLDTIAAFERDLIDTLNHYTVTSSYPAALQLHE